MGIPESQLDTWSHQGSIAQSSTTYATIKSALEAADTKYSGKSYEVFLQGSYGNNTNIYAESDVDVVIRLDSTYHYDTTSLTPQELLVFNAGFIPGTYPYAEYKAHVVAALQKRFGVAVVKPDTKAN
jgi:tRNA nucleotidyltransferase (CCA-adding enzyme)